ncbi:MAG: hypothetical protein JRJ84_15225 [Deltaproteobacteria bacterium]|nr:hypothetical protein [Deltaproteobacteria bacterium]
MADENETEERPANPVVRPEMRPDGKRMKDSDRTTRPGFRNPANTRSKASKKKTKRKKKGR